MFVVLEGGAGGGKTTQIDLLVKALSEMGCRVKRVSVLDDTEVGRQVRQITKVVPHGKLGHRAEALLYLAAIGSAEDCLISPALAEGFIVVGDRYISSTTAYQGYGGKLPLRWLKRIGILAVEGVLPNLTVYLDVPVEEGLARRKDDPHFAQLPFRRRVRNGYLRMAKRDPNWLVVDATQSAEKVHEAILAAVVARL